MRIIFIVFGYSGRGNAPRPTRNHQPLTMNPRQRDALFWNPDPPRGKVSDKCLWAACKAMTTGLLLIVIGASMATLGFYSDHLATTRERRGNTTVLVKNENFEKHLDSLTYVGPLVMGIGGFIIVATCVMTFEARDTSSSSAKFVSAWFKRSRSYVAPRPEISCGATSVSDVSWERFLPGVRHDSTVTEVDRSMVTNALINFSKNLQNSFDGRVVPPGSASAENSSSPREKLHKSQSDPNIGLGSPTFRTTSPLQREEGSAAERECFLRPPNPQLLRPRPFNVSPHDYRKVVSMDCPSPPTVEPLAESLPAHSISSQGSMAMDVYLPEGSVTLKVKDKTKRSDSISPKEPRRGSHASTASSGRFSQDARSSVDSCSSTASHSHSSRVPTSPKSKEAQTSPRDRWKTRQRAASSAAVVLHQHGIGDVHRTPALATASKSTTMKRHPFMRQKAIEASASPEKVPQA
ncbi:uncharacterized protein LOC135398827 isoform X2 [Ornithodoros turicata]|uniref:uncharacterized protein LOC135398827 isoform X2 n=1 Tax=Ornithodoros turicata TaxID=34597 RepID=UPI00313A493C